MPQDPDPQSLIATVDAVILTIEDGRLKVLLHRRPRKPYRGAWALPGGFIRPLEDADADSAIRRVLADKVGTSGFYLEQLATYSGASRDPRGWSLSVTHLALVPRPSLAFSEGEDTLLIPVGDATDLAFDHAAIVADAVARLRGKGGYSTLPASLLGATFTLGDMQEAYEVVLADLIDPSSFRRKVLELGILEDTGDEQKGGRRRPAKLYRLRQAVATFDRTLGRSAG